MTLLDFEHTNIELKAFGLNDRIGSPTSFMTFLKNILKIMHCWGSNPYLVADPLLRFDRDIEGVSIRRGKIILGLKMISSYVS